jgi:hypothetical protein
MPSREAASSSFGWAEFPSPAPSVSEALPVSLAAGEKDQCGSFAFGAASGSDTALGRRKTLGGRRTWVVAVVRGSWLTERTATATAALFRKALAVDELTWARARGWALSWALVYIPYYLDTDPVGVGRALRPVAEVLTHR